MDRRPTSPELHRRHDLDGLRGIAVVLVVCFHAGLPGLRGAFVAVDIFFVLSGFFLTTALARRIATGESLDVVGVFSRRAWRLIPAMAVVLLATLASAMWLYAPIDRADVAARMTPVALFAGNIAFAATGVDYFHSGANPFLHTWTLGVEWQLALVLPAVIAWLSAAGARRAAGAPPADVREAAMRSAFTGIVVLGAASFAAATIINEIAPMWAYFGPHTRLWAYAAGAAMAFFAGGGQSAIGHGRLRVSLVQMVGLTAILVPALFYRGTMAYPGMISLVPVGGALLLIGGGAPATNTPVGRALGASWLTALGRVSYSWYLWHYPAMMLGGVLFPSIGAWSRLACGVAALVPAALTQQFIEGFAREWVKADRPKGHPLAWAGSVCAGLALLAMWASARSNAYVARSEHRVFAAARADHMTGSCWASRVGVGGGGWNDGCAFGNPAAPATIALLGDSHAEHWLGGLDRAGKERGWRVESYVMGGCPAASLSGLVDAAELPAYAGCLAYRDETIDRVIARRPDAVILSNSDHYIDFGAGGAMDAYRVSPDVWAEGLRRTYRRLSRAGLTVIVIRDVPLVPFDVPSCLSRRAERLPLAADCTFAPDRSVMAIARAAQNVAAIGLGIRFVDMNDLVCASDPCATMRSGVVRYTDDDHLTATFARSLGGVLGARLTAAAAERGPSLLERTVGHAADILLTARKLP